MIIKKKNNNIDTDETPSIEHVVPKTIDEEQEEVIKNLKDFDITNVEFKERIERRRGDRRRGYRRIDERSLVSRAQEEAQSIRANALHEGYQEGLQNAQKDIEELNLSLQKFLNAKDEVYEYVSSDILELAIETAKKIINKEVELSDEVLKNILQEVLSQTSLDEQKITVKVSALDFEVAQEEINKILANRQFEVKISVLPDDSIQRGSCTLITSNGVIDANFSTQLDIIQKALGIYKKEKDEN